MFSALEPGVTAFSRPCLEDRAGDCSLLTVPWSPLNSAAIFRRPSTPPYILRRQAESPAHSTLLYIAQRRLILQPEIIQLSRKMKTGNWLKSGVVRPATVFSRQYLVLAICKLSHDFFTDSKAASSPVQNETFLCLFAWLLYFGQFKATLCNWIKSVIIFNARII